MKRIFLAVSAAVLAACGGAAMAAEPPSRYVDPLIGTLASKLPHTVRGGPHLRIRRAPGA